MHVTVDERSSRSGTGALRLARVAFTGKLVSMTRHEAHDLVQGAGGQVTTTVSRRTSMLVVGLDGWPLLDDGTPSRKLARAESLNRSGAHIRIVPETVFLEIAGVAPGTDAVVKGYTATQVAELLGLDEPTLRRWEVLGLVGSEDGRYDFQDIVSLRAIGELVGRGVSLRDVGRGIRGLSSAIPDTQRPLSQLKIIERSGDLLAELGESLVAPDGQLVMDFDPAAGPDDGPAANSRADASPVAGAIDGRPDTAEGWFARGHEAEEGDRLEEAIGSYRAALRLQTHFPEAHFNLANCLRALGRVEAAEEHLLLAVSQDPALDFGWYNLADVQEEQGRVDDAIDSLVTALKASPQYADAHYNVALCYEQAGRDDDARRHWRAYLELDPDSPWADTARAHLGAAPDD